MMSRFVSSMSHKLMSSSIFSPLDLVVVFFIKAWPTNVRPCPFMHVLTELSATRTTSVGKKRFPLLITQRASLRGVQIDHGYELFAITSGGGS